MRADVKAPKPKTTDCRDRVQTLKIVADNESDQAILALIYRMLFKVGVKPENPRLELYRLLREQVADQDKFPEA